MFPWVFGFKWQTGNLVFLGIFYSVVTVILTTFVIAVRRAVKNINSNQVDKISWHDDFSDLPASAKVCRHVFTGDLEHRTCPNGFDCRICELHPEILLEKTLNHATTSQDQKDYSNVSFPHAPNGDSVDSQSRFPIKSLGNDNREASLFGLDMPTDRLYHRGHTWVKKEQDCTLTVGLDDFAKRIVGKPDIIELPKLGTNLEVNGTGWFLEKNGTKIRILSPVEGKVIATDNKIDDFFIRVKPKNGLDLRYLLKGSEIYPWIMREMERLEVLLTTEKVGISLADGGELVNDLPKNYPGANWDKVLGEMFLES